MKKLFWLSYRNDNSLAGVVIIEARELLEARMLACIDGLDGSAEFADGYELSPEQVAMISPQSVGRLLAPAEVSRLISWIKSELQRKNMEINQQHLESIDRFAIASELFDDPAHCLPADALGRLAGENKTRIRSLGG